METSTTGRSPGLLWLRGGVLVGATLWLLAGPIWRQALDHKDDFWLPKWTMFDGFAGSMCLTEYHQGRGLDAPKLDPFVVLGIDDPWMSPKSMRRLEGWSDVELLGRRMCRALGPDADVRAHTWCRKEDRWDRVAKARRNLCEQSPRGRRP